MKDRLDDGIGVLEQLAKYYDEKQSFFTQRKEYEEAKRIHLMGRGIKHALTALRNLKNHQIEII